MLQIGEMVINQNDNPKAQQGGWICENLKF